METQKSSDEYIELLKKLRDERESQKSYYKSLNIKREVPSKKDREEILAKTEGRCHICGGEIEGRWDADHVKSHSKGGENSVDNYLPAHHLCNSYRWDYLPEEFQEILKIGVWARTLMENQKTPLSKDLTEAYVKKENARITRRTKK